MNLHPCLLLLPGSILVVNAALAAETEEIEIIGRTANLVGIASSASQGTVSGAELEQRPILRTGEILEVVPGLVATQHSGSGKANQYFLRGFNLDHGTDFSTSIDGMPINMRSHGHGQGYTDLGFIIPEMIQEINYRKGSYYADVGDFSGAGSARITSTDTLDALKFNLGYGGNGYQRFLVTGDVNSQTADLIYGVEWQTYSGPWDSIDEDVDKKNLWLKRHWENQSDSLDITLMAYDNTWNSADQIPDRAVESGLISSLGSIDPTLAGNSSRYSLSANWQTRFENGQLNASVYAIDYSMDLFSNFTYFTTPQGDQFNQIDERNIYGGDLEFLHSFNLANLEMTNRYGFQHRFDDIKQVGLISTRERMPLRDIRLDAVDESSSSLYFENQIHWSPKLRSIFGLRYDYYDFTVNPLASANTAALSANGGKASDDIFTSTFNLVYELSSEYEVYASIGEGFHSNDARGTTISLDPVDGTPVNRVDPLVSTLGYEVGMRAFLSDVLNASVAIWQLDIDSELLFVGDAGNTEDTGVGTGRNGVELTAYYQFSPRTSLDVEYSWTNAEFNQIVDGSTEVPGALSNVFSGGINFQLVDKLSTYLRVRHFGEFPLDGGQRADGSTLVNLRTGYTFNDNVKLTVDVLNVLDSDDHDIEYFYESQLASEASPVEDHHYHIFEPRSVRAYLTLTF